MSDSYWTRALRHRVSRRYALAATGSTAAAAAFLAACGGSSNNNSSSTTSGGTSTGATGATGASSGSTGAASGASSASGASGPATSSLLINGKEVDTTASAKRGGTWKAVLSRDPQNFDLYNFDPFSQGFANGVGSKLVWIQPSRMKDPTGLDIAGDISSSWEISPDKLTYTFKLNPAAKFSPLSPSFHQGAPQSIANRQFDTDDVMFSWDRFQSVSSNAGELSAAKSPTGPITSMTAPDKSTIVMKLAQPYAPLLGTLANASVSYFYILPKEGQGQDVNFFNKYQFGSGPFYIDQFEPSVKLVLKRNPNYEARDVGDGGLKRPFVDEVDFTIIPDPTATLAQFRAGQIYLGPNGMTVDDILQTKKDFPEMQMRSVQSTTPVTEWFGMSADGPWKDQRVRQAVQYSWDRNTFIDVIYATNKLKAAGIPFDYRWNTAIPGGGPGDYMYFPGMWLDPQGKDFGENAKYFTLGSHDQNVAEAKKLLSAAGHANGIDFRHIQYPLGFGQQQAQDVIEGMYQDIGLKATQDKVTIPDIFNYIFHKPGEAGGNWKEMLNTVDFGGPDVGNYLLGHFHPSGNLFGGWNPDDTGASIKGDPVLTDTVSKVLLEFDNTAKVKLVQDFQRYMAKMFYYNRYPGGAVNLFMAWPAIANYNTWRNQNLNHSYTYEWLDPTKKPLSS